MALRHYGQRAQGSPPDTTVPLTCPQAFFTKKGAAAGGAYAAGAPAAGSHILINTPSEVLMVLTVLTVL